MTMESPHEQQEIRARRWFAGLGVLVLFGALFVLPLCAALTLCTMPCCHHETDATGSLVSGVMTGCEMTCGIRSAEASPTTLAGLAPQSSSPRISPAAVAVSELPVAPAATILLPQDAPSPHRGDASLLVLISVFRI